MKKIILASLVLLGACGKQAALIKAPNSTFEKRMTFNGMSVDIQNKTFAPEARDVTLLMYPTVEDVANFEYSPDADTQPSWDDLLQQLPAHYRDRMSTTLPTSMSASAKVVEVVAWINTAGAVRDDKFRFRLPLLAEQEQVQKRLTEEDAKFRPAINEALSAYSCFFKSRPARGQKWDCRTVADAVYKTKRTPTNCADMNEYTFVFATSDVETQYQAAKEQCITNTNALNAAIAPFKERDAQIEELVLKATTTRDSAKAVVLNLLESLEKVTTQVFVSAVSSLDKKMDCPGDAAGVKCLSQIKFGAKNETIEEFAIYADFGVYAAEKLQTQEYSLANGRIRDLKFYTDKDGVRMLEFTMVTDLLTLKAKLSMTVQDDMQLRFVGETNIDYKDGKHRRGVLKLEFNEAK